MNPGEAIHYQLYAVNTVCRCPRCGREHKLKINWQGRGVPAKFCHNCNRYLESRTNEDTPSVVKELNFLKSLPRIWKKCRCHDRYVFSCPAFKAHFNTYLFCRIAEINSLRMETQLFLRESIAK